MKLDRDLQREILQKLADAYPGPTSGAWDEIQELTDTDTLVGNLLYLEAHGLIESGLRQSASGQHSISTGGLKITARGLDFLADDGGLSAILGVVTIRLHDDQIRLLLEARIQGSDAPEEEKRKWLDQLRGIPADATKHLVHKLIDAGLAQWPTVLSAMQTLAT